MNDENIQLSRIGEIEKELLSFNQASTIPFEVYKSFQSRLGLANFPTMLWGTVTLAGGAASVTDGRIKASSTVVASGTITTYNIAAGAFVGGGKANFASSNGADTQVVNYVIVF